MKKYNYFLFDLDGTLIKTEKLILECFKYSLNYFFKKKILEERILEKIGLPLKEQIEQLYSEYKLTPVDFETFQKIHMNYQLTIWQDYLELFPSTQKILTTLKQAKKKLAIVTSRKKKTTHLYLKHTKIFDFFSNIITPEDTVQHKPYAQPALKAMKDLQASPQETLFVGDSQHDIKCAQAAKIDSYLVVWNEKKVTAFPTYREKNLEKILIFI